ncbi:mononuclear molybdenum enzyme YedY [Methylobacillus sp. MM3]|jgi:sulfoxide reductase catalytic subunit YedY|uniref:protein-methionine-sulfoxide reductase catalytic subunit MsrP n=1 Tax=Methylobacillus sp. MM3 TaxID=1848039 RepID=UPI0007DF665D|nr:protein-methionine-sulfoxide reductase catalytic subunit MsrP [Methylobacillus sp. MM3]OAJ71591.1 mononuclear molybdenum enzyme YedY [Methylobacillus sp. MM3]
MKHVPIIPASEITPREIYQGRREFIKVAGLGAIAGAAMLSGMSFDAAAAQSPRRKIGKFVKTPYGSDEKLTPYEDITTYNNFYEFGTNKSDPSQYAGSLVTRPWTVNIEGEVKRPKSIAIDDIFKLAPLEERIYRMRCVEGWSMVIPWVGFPLADLIKWAEPTGNAKYIEFITLDNQQMMPGQRSGVLDWPYNEGLRLDEAMHPLTILAVGLYGEVLPNQNGAPLRLVVPWKYGFKGIKSIVKIRFTEKMPVSSWMKAGPSEYGFYSNVNPNVDHPRWSQATERRIGEGLFARRRKTLMFNGYAEQVGQMYAGMDLKKYF